MDPFSFSTIYQNQSKTSSSSSSSSPTLSKEMSSVLREKMIKTFGEKNKNKTKNKELETLEKEKEKEKKVEKKGEKEKEKEMITSTSNTHFVSITLPLPEQTYSLPLESTPKEQTNESFSVNSIPIPISNQLPSYFIDSPLSLSWNPSVYPQDMYLRNPPTRIQGQTQAPKMKMQFSSNQKTTPTVKNKNVSLINPTQMKFSFLSYL